MEAKTCEEFVLGYVKQLEAQKAGLEEELKKAKDAVNYADRILGIVRQVIKIEKRAVNEKDKPLEEAWVLAPTTAGVKLDLGNGNDRSLFILMTPIIGDDAAKAELEAMRSTKEEKE
jgi:hypothetical protein